MKPHFTSQRLWMFTVLLVLPALMAPASADILWDTGRPRPIVYNNTTQYLIMTSGYHSAGPRYFASPFQAADDWVLQKITFDTRLIGGNTGVAMRIYERTGLEAPGAVVWEGAIGGPPGYDHDERVDDWQAQGWNLVDIWSWDLPNIALAAGDYYVSFYGTGGYGTGVYFGAQEQREDLEMSDGIWRSPDGATGWFKWGPGVISPPNDPRFPDPDDTFNLSFRLEGVPEPSSLFAAGFGLVAVAARHRVRRSR